MKIEKNKIVFASVVVVVVIFIVAYSTLVLIGGEEELENLEQISVPELKEENEPYSSKIDALDDLKEERERVVPSIYSEELLDSLGVYDPFLEEKEKEWAVDSLFNYGRIDYEEGDYREEDYEEENPEVVEIPETTQNPAPDFQEQHMAFFRTSPVEPPAEVEIMSTDEEQRFLAEVNGDQQVRVNDRLELILAEDMVLGERKFLKNTLVYGFVSFQPNRVLLKVTHINNYPIQLKAYDLQDGNEGIYIENSFRSEAQREILDDVVQDLNIAGLPQISGIKNIFRRNNKNIKVNILDQYKLILKP